MIPRALRPSSPPLCATGSWCSLAADQMRCNLKLPGPTQNGESSSSVPGDGDGLADGLSQEGKKKNPLIF